MDRVVYTQRVEVVRSYGERRDCADQRIPRFILACGYMPVPCPNVSDGGYVDDLLELTRPKGIVLTGGNSLVKCGGDAPERDWTDGYLIAASIHRGIPVYGFCRGMQSILDHFGVALVDVKGHVAARHGLVGAYPGIAEANSYHNQGALGPDGGELDVVLRSDDGVWEMVRHRKLPIVGTMWHPEREEPFREADIDIVRGLFG